MQQLKLKDLFPACGSHEVSKVIYSNLEGFSFTALSSIYPKNHLNFNQLAWKPHAWEPKKKKPTHLKQGRVFFINTPSYL